MSSPSVASAVLVTADSKQLSDTGSGKRSARIRTATVRRRVLQVTDALAAADLLLGIHAALAGDREARP